MAVQDFEAQLRITPGNVNAKNYLMVAIMEKPQEESQQGIDGNITIMGQYNGTGKFEEKDFTQIKDFLEKPLEGDYPDCVYLEFGHGRLELSKLPNFEKMKAVMEREMESYMRNNGDKTLAEFHNEGLKFGNRKGL
jgi:hypothetical protein